MALNTYLIRKEWMTLGDDFVINSTEDDGEGVAYSINNKILHLRETYHFEDPDGNVLYKIMERNVPNHRVVIYDDDEERVAVVRKRGDGTYWAMVDGDRDLFVSGDVETGGVLFSNVGGLNVARMTEAWLFAIQDMFQIDIRADQEDSLIMAVMTAVQVSHFVILFDASTSTDFLFIAHSTLQEMREMTMMMMRKGLV